MRFIEAKYFFGVLEAINYFVAACIHYCVEPKFKLEVNKNGPREIYPRTPRLRTAGLDIVENRPFRNLFRSESRSLPRRNIPLHMRSKVQTVVVQRSFNAYTFC